MIQPLDSVPGLGFEGKKEGKDNGVARLGSGLDSGLGEKRRKTAVGISDSFEMKRRGRYSEGEERGLLIFLSTRRTARFKA